MKNLLKQNEILYFKKLIGKAGKRALQLQQKKIHIKRKEDSSIVTEADLMVQELLIQSIRKKYRDVNFIHEEEFSRNPMSIKSNDITVIIDPIDGTSMYSMYLPIWCISVGIFFGNDPAYGFVYAPGLDMFFYNDDNQSYINNNPVKIKQSFEIDSETNIFYATEIYRIVDINFPGKARNLGSTALHACLTIDNARNRTLAFIGKSWIWDWAGAIPVILKSGGNLRYLNGNYFELNRIIENNYKLPDFLIAYTHQDYQIVRKCFKVFK